MQTAEAYSAAQSYAAKLNRFESLWYVLQIVFREACCQRQVWRQPHLCNLCDRNILRRVFHSFLRLCSFRCLCCCLSCSFGLSFLGFLAFFQCFALVCLPLSLCLFFHLVDGFGLFFFGFFFGFFLDCGGYLSKNSDNDSLDAVMQKQETSRNAKRCRNRAWMCIWQTCPSWLMPRMHRRPQAPLPLSAVSRPLLIEIKSYCGTILIPSSLSAFWNR